MLLHVRGWNRNMGKNRIGSPDLRSSIVTEARPERYSPDKTYLTKLDDGIDIAWRADLRLTGTYLTHLSLSRNDVALMFRQCFGTELHLDTLEALGLHLTDDGLRERIAQMTIGDFLALLDVRSDATQANDESQRPTFAKMTQTA